MKHADIWMILMAGICLLAMASRRGESQSEPLRRVPPEIARLALKEGDIPGRGWEGPSWDGGAQYPTGEKVVVQAFRQWDTDDSGKRVGNRVVSVWIIYCPDLLTAVEQAYVETTVRQSPVPMPSGTLSNLPLGADGVWRSGGLRKVGDKIVYTNYTLVFWKDNIVCKIQFGKNGTWIREPLSEAEMHLTENVARKILANKEGKQFTIATAAPKTWQVMPVSVVLRGKEMKGGARMVTCADEVYAAPDALTALGLTVKAEKIPERQKMSREAFKEFYLNKVKTVEVAKGKTHLKFEIGEKFYLVNGKRTPLDTPARLVDGVPLVPLEAAAKALKLSFVWDAQHRVARVG
jgi:hypothetical protein